MERIALFPGSFDPFTLGHMAVAVRGLTLFDRVLIGVGVNPGKAGGAAAGAISGVGGGAKHGGLLTPERRIELIDNVFGDNPRIEATMYEGLTVDFCHERGIGHILRGIRGFADFEYEHAMEMANRRMHPDITTVAIFTPAEYIPVSSRLVREIITMGGDASMFLPEGINIKDYL